MSHLWHLICVYTVCQCFIYGSPGRNGLNKRLCSCTGPSGYEFGYQARKSCYGHIISPLHGACIHITQMSKRQQTNAQSQTYRNLLPGRSKFLLLFGCCHLNKCSYTMQGAYLFCAIQSDTSVTYWFLFEKVGKN